MSAVSLHAMPGALLRWARRLAIPILAGGVVAAAGFALAQVLKDREAEVIARLVDTEAARLKAELGEQISRRMLAIRVLAEIGERKPGIDAEEWEKEASRLLVENLQFRAIEWVEPSLELRWAAPPTSRIPGATLDSLDDPLRLEQLRRIEDHTDASVSRSYVVAEGHRQVLIAAPMFVAGKGAGFMAGVLRLRDLLDTVMTDALARGYTVAIYEEPYLIYGASWLGSGGEAVWARDYDLELGDHAWRVQVWPCAELMAALRAEAGGVSGGAVPSDAIAIEPAMGEEAPPSAPTAEPPQKAEATASAAPTPEH